MSCFGIGKKKATAQQTDDTDDDFVKVDGATPHNMAGDVTSQDTPRNGPSKLFAKEQKIDDKLVGVVVTIFQGNSYDNMFREVQPSTVSGERVSTYSLDCCYVAELQEYLASTRQLPSAPSAWRDLVGDIQEVQPDCVTFNWECCSACGVQGFPLCGGGRRSGSRAKGRTSGRLTGAASPTMQLMGLLVRRGHTVMCSDFSLKALISEWSVEHLGPNPFINAGYCEDQFQLDFIPAELQNEEVPQQLQVVGELCASQGKAIVTALGDTILYSVDPNRPNTELYDLKVLTVVSAWGGRGRDVPEALKCSMGSGESERRGVAGHVTLTYASGGQLVTSMGHWIELTRIDTTLDSVMRVAMRNFGDEECHALRAEMNGLSLESERQECVQKWAKSHVQKSVPSRMKCRTKFSVD